ncbi:hypothetical protein Tco_0149623 [Tanacetum coccineum]
MATCLRAVTGTIFTGSHHRSSVGQPRSTVAGPRSTTAGTNRSTTAGHSVLKRWLTASQRSGQMVATAATWHATSANWVPVAYVAATLAADVAEGIITFQHRFELGTS